MLIVPYSTALTISRPPIVSYVILGICVLVFLLQQSLPVTQYLTYLPDSWNPIRMITASFAHADFMHLLLNMLFFMAFAPAIEIITGSRLQYLSILLLISFVVGISYSISILIGNADPQPTLGFSGIAMGIVGLAAYLMPRARIRVFYWFIIIWGTVFVPAWILAVAFVGLDIWTLFSAMDNAGVNLVAHVAGGIGGYCYGLICMKQRREDISDELEAEIEAIDIERREGKTRAQAHRYNKAITPIETQKKQDLAYEKFMLRIYRMVKADRDSEAILELLEKFELGIFYTELEPVFERASEWGPSRALLCLGRLIIHRLENEKRFGAALVYIEKCQAVSPQFILPDVSKTLFYAQMAIDTGKPEIARNLVMEPIKRYGALVNHEQCNHLYEKAKNLS